MPNFLTFAFPGDVCLRDCRRTQTFSIVNLTPLISLKGSWFGEREARRSLDSLFGQSSETERVQIEVLAGITKSKCERDSL